MPNNKEQERIDGIRKDFAKRVYDLYINAANGKIDTYDKFLTRLEWLEIDYSDTLSPYGIYEDLCPDDFDLVKMAIEEGTPLNESAYQWLSIYSIIEFAKVAASSLMPPVSDNQPSDNA